MAVKKHHLTAGIDKIKGSAGKDLFVAENAFLDNYDLSGVDKLNGGKGIDTIRAAIADVVGAPVMKNIERGIFEIASDGATLDLQHAGQMKSLTLRSFDDVAPIEITVEKASAVNTIRVIGGDQNDVNVINGLDPTASKTLKLSLINASSDLGCLAVGVKPFKAVELTLVDVLLPTIWGNALSAKEVTIRSMGDLINQAIFDPGQYSGTTRHLTIEGDTQFIMVSNGSEIFQHLYSVDLTGMTAQSQIYVGGEKLRSIKGGGGNDVVGISELGGSAKHKARIDLGKGYDGVGLAADCYDAATQRIDGGKGWDTISFFGHVSDIAKGIRNFEAAYFYDAIGNYDLQGLSMVYELGNTKGAVTFDHVRSGSNIELLYDSTNFLTINVDNATGSRKESVNLLLNSYMSNYGNAVVGLIAPDLSELRIEVQKYAHTFHLTSIGSAADGATIIISGEGRLALGSTTGSTQHIDRITITNTGGVDLSGLENGNQALLGTGATITGGAGDDVLIGSSGADTIATGGGDNIVLGSLSADSIILDAGSGLDKIIYRAEGESGYGLGFDTITNFSASDVIDVSSFADVTYMGSVPSNANGKLTLSTQHRCAFFNSTNDTLYIDMDRDGNLGFDDMQIVLTGLSSFTFANLIG